MLLTQLPKSRQQIILLKICQKTVVLQCPLRQHDTNHIFERTGFGAADAGEHTYQDVLLIEVFNLQVIEALRALLAGKELNVLFDDRFVLLSNPQIYGQ